MSKTKQTGSGQKPRAFACDNDTWMKCDERAQELHVTKSEYIRRLIEDDIKQRQEFLRRGHTNELIKLQIDRGANINQ